MYLVPIYRNHIMFAHDLWNSQIEYLCNYIDLIRKDRAKRYHKSSVFNLQFPDKSGSSLRCDRLSLSGLGVGCQPGLWPRVSSLIVEETLKKANVEYRIMNIECRRNVFYLFYKKMERSDSILPHSAFRLPHSSNVVSFLI